MKGHFMKNSIYVSGDINSGNVYLTPGFQPPTDSGGLYEHIRVHSEMQSYASGGAIFHVNIEEPMNVSAKNKFIKSLFENHPIRYISLTPFLSICNKCGIKQIGKRFTCSKCGSDDVTCWSRPVGYFRPAVKGNISDNLHNATEKFWSKHKIEELSKRILYKSNSLESVK